MFSRITSGPSFPDQPGVAPQGVVATSGSSASAAAPADPALAQTGVMSSASASAAAPACPMAAADAAAHREFWSSNDARRHATGFPAQDEALTLRTANQNVSAQVDRAIKAATPQTTQGVNGPSGQAIRAVTLGTDEIDTFFTSTRFEHVDRPCLRYRDMEGVRRLADHLAAHPRPGLTLELVRDTYIDAETAARLAPLPLGGLVLRPKEGHRNQEMPTEVVETLAACAFPVELRVNLELDGFAAAARMPTLRRLETTSPVNYDDVARLFTAHPALQVLSIDKATHLSGRGIEAFAALPNLRTLSIGTSDLTVFNAPVLSALAASGTLESFVLKDRSGPCLGLTEEGFAALSQSRTLTSLAVPLRPGMAQLAGVTSLRSLVFNNANFVSNPATLDATSARGLAALPLLQTIDFPNIRCDADVMKILLDGSAASSLKFEQHHVFSGEALSALQANTRLREVVFGWPIKENIDSMTVPALRLHPTLERLRIGDVEYRRLPGHVPLMPQLASR